MRGSHLEPHLLCGAPPPLPIAATPQHCQLRLCHRHFHLLKHQQNSLSSLSTISTCAQSVFWEFCPPVFQLHNNSSAAAALLMSDSISCTSAWLFGKHWCCPHDRALLNWLLSYKKICVLLVCTLATYYFANASWLRVVNWCGMGWDGTVLVIVMVMVMVRVSWKIFWIWLGGWVTVLGYSHLSLYGCFSSQMLNGSILNHTK